MNADKQKYFYETYPDFFSNKDKSVQESCMCWGIEFEDGWFDILETLCRAIKNHIDNIQWHNDWAIKEGKKTTLFIPFKFDQLKEKYGTMRAYYSGGDDYVSGLVDMAERMSGKICEFCGNPGKLCGRGWYTTLCKECSDKRGIYYPEPGNNEEEF